MWINRTLDHCAMEEYSAAHLKVSKPLHMPTEWVLVVRNSQQRWGVPSTVMARAIISTISQILFGPSLRQMPVLGAVRQQSSVEPMPTSVMANETQSSRCSDGTNMKWVWEHIKEASSARVGI